MTFDSLNRIHTHLSHQYHQNIKTIVIAWYIHISKAILNSSSRTKPCYESMSNNFAGCLAYDKKYDKVCHGFLWFPCYKDKFKWRCVGLMSVAFLLQLRYNIIWPCFIQILFSYFTPQGSNKKPRTKILFLLY